jgi:hypothetical protein
MNVPRPYAQGRGSQDKYPHIQVKPNPRGGAIASSEETTRFVIAKYGDLRARLLLLICFLVPIVLLFRLLAHHKVRPDPLINIGFANIELKEILRTDRLLGVPDQDGWNRALQLMMKSTEEVRLPTDRRRWVPPIQFLYEHGEALPSPIESQPRGLSLVGLDIDVFLPVIGLHPEWFHANKAFFQRHIQMDMYQFERVADALREVSQNIEHYPEDQPAREWLLKNHPKAMSGFRYSMVPELFWGLLNGFFAPRNDGRSSARETVGLAVVTHVLGEKLNVLKLIDHKNTAAMLEQLNEVRPDLLEHIRPMLRVPKHIMELLWNRSWPFIKKGLQVLAIIGGVWAFVMMIPVFRDAFKMLLSQRENSLNAQGLTFPGILRAT